MRSSDVDMSVPVPKTRTDASRHFRLCLDWTERRFHLAGSIPNAVLHHLLEGGLVVAASKLSSNVTVAGKAWFGQLGSTRRRGQPPNHRHRRELPSVGLRPAAVYARRREIKQTRCGGGRTMLRGRPATSPRLEASPLQLHLSACGLEMASLVKTYRGKRGRLPPQMGRIPRRR
jgi:hypothetical protein